MLGKVCLIHSRLFNGRLESGVAIKYPINLRLLTNPSDLQNTKSTCKSIQARVIGQCLVRPYEIASNGNQPQFLDKIEKVSCLNLYFA